MEDRVWDNLRSTGLLQEILSRSAQTGDILGYVGVNFGAEIGLSDETRREIMIIKIFIKHDTHVQPVTPKIYRITSDREEQKRLSGQIWDGLTLEDIKFIAEIKAEMFREVDKNGGLETFRSLVIRKLYPAIKKGHISIELLPDYAQYMIALEKLFHFL